MNYFKEETEEQIFKKYSFQRIINETAVMVKFCYVQDI